ncbi:MAG TPA: hypothetical protein VGB55_16130 [Tepidisphaeraceae bacterium]|jgi:hypothetical protein
MGAALYTLAIVASIGSLICWVIVLAAIFRAGQMWQGIVGIICGLFAFVWGWMQVDRLGIRTVMIFWTIFSLAAIGLSAFVASTATPAEVLTERYE